MSRNVIVGLAVLVVAVLAWIVITRTDDVAEAPDAIETEEGVPATDPQVVDDGDTDIVVEGDAEFVDGDTESEPTVEEAIAGSTEEAPESEMPDTTEEAEAAADANGGDAVVAEDGAEADATGEPAAAPTEEATADAEPETATTGDSGATTGPATDDATEATGTEVTEGDTAEADAATDTDTAPAADAAGTEATETEATAPGNDTVEAVDAETANATEEAIDDAAAAETDLDTLLTPEGFNAEDLIDVVDQSDLDDAAKADLRTRIEEAEGDRDLVPDVIEELRTRLDVE